MSQLFAGIARCDITPPLGAPLFGYSMERFGFEIADRLSATALALQFGDTNALIFSIDWCLIDEDETAAIRNAVSEATGIPGRSITLCATHTHSGPVTVNCWGWGEKDTTYLLEVRTKFVEAAQRALHDLQVVRVGIGVSQSDIGINRREVLPDGGTVTGFNEWGCRDADLTVIRFEGKDGAVAQIVHLAAHATSRGIDPAVSRDWPGVMIDRVEQITKAPVLFINGAAGDVAPRTTIGGGYGDGPIASDEVGLRAAGDAVRTWRSIKEFRDLSLETLSADIALPLAPLPSDVEARRQLQQRAGDETRRGEAGAEWHYWNAVHEAHKRPPRNERTFQQTITRIGAAAIVPFAGEVFAEIGLRLKKASPLAFPLVAGTSNGSHGYYVTREARGRGGYEVWVARAYGAYLLATDIDDVLVKENLKLLQRLVAGGE